MLTPSDLAIPPGEAFSCRRCNRCCRGPWVIGITAAEADRLRKLYPEIEPTAGVEILKGETLYAMRRTSDGAAGAGGACVYLDPDGCRIQKDHGAAAKPAVCHRFPYFPRAIAGGVYVHLSRMCPTVYDAKGKAGEALAADVLAAYPDLKPGPALEKVRFAGSAEISWEEYRGFEDQLAALIMDDRWSLDDAVASGYWLIQRVARNEAPGRAGVGACAPFEPRSRSGDEASNSPVLRQAQDERGRKDPGLDPIVDLVMTSIAKRNPMLGLYRYVMAATVTVIESERGRTGRFEAWKGDMSLYGRLLFRRGIARLRSIEAPVDLRRLPEVAWPRRNRPDLSPVRRYLVSHLRHKLLLQAPDVEYAYNLLIGAYATIKFYARASAVSAGRERMIAEDVRRGVEIVEYNLLLHRPLEGAALEKRLVRGWFRKFLFHPAYASSMIAF
jgi:Fe-S-cluster containining protein